jgi:hypothetical protein
MKASRIPLHHITPHLRGSMVRYVVHHFEQHRIVRLESSFQQKFDAVVLTEQLGNSGIPRQVYP